MDIAKHETSAIVQELQASQARLGMARHHVPVDMVPVQGLLLQHNLGNALRLSADRVSKGATQRQYGDMRQALAAWEENDPRFAPARERAFFGALRNLLMVGSLWPSTVTTSQVYFCYFCSRATNPSPFSGLTCFLLPYFAPVLRLQHTKLHPCIACLCLSWLLLKCFCPALPMISVLQFSLTPFRP